MVITTIINEDGGILMLGGPSTSRDLIFDDELNEDEAMMLFRELLVLARYGASADIKNLPNIRKSPYNRP